MPRSHTSPRTPAQIVAHWAEIARRYLAGETQAAIAQELGISQATVSADLAALRKHWLESAAQDFDTLKARELARIDQLETTYWAAWDASKQGGERRRQEIDVANARPKSISIETEASAGDPRYLDGVQWCIEQRCKIFGLHTPQKAMGLLGLVVRHV